MYLYQYGGVDILIGGSSPSFVKGTMHDLGGGLGLELILCWWRGGMSTRTHTFGTSPESGFTFYFAARMPDTYISYYAIFYEVAHVRRTSVLEVPTEPRG